MKLVSFQRGDDTTRCGALIADGDAVLDFTHPALEIPTPDAYLGWFDTATPSHAAARAAHDGLDDTAIGSLRECGAVVARDDVCLGAPVPRPGKVICIGLNYRDHAEESGMAVPESPVSFSKFSTSVVGPDEAVVLPRGATEVDYEAEMGVVIGKHAKHVDETAAWDHILGYVNLNDVSARDFQFKDGQWQRGKAADTFCPIGDYIATRDEITDPHNLSIKLHLNGETLQDSCTDQLVFQCHELVSFLSQSVTLEPGDIIATGTPPGVGFARKPPIYLKDGDVMEVDIEGLGRLRNPVRASD